MNSKDSVTREVRAYVPEVNADFTLVVPYERQLVTHKETFQ